jgi:hypothetical protein
MHEILVKYSFLLPKVLTFVNGKFVFVCLAFQCFSEGILALLAKITHCFEGAEVFTVPH